MLLTNHALTGVWLGTVIESPLIVLPAGVASHLLLDSTPHAAWVPRPFLTYKVKGPDIPGWSFFKTPVNFLMGSLDFAGALTMLGLGLYAFPARRVQIACGWLGAVAPDLLYLPEIFFKRRFFPRFKALHHNIQWSESPYGIATEVLWGLFMLYMTYGVQVI
ncbi:hypothetical protein HJC99_03410 [Candidatus Saccharibacteria bacterium]|nr:hypothetical protein [Candidatus Saccharibacteria bacterium]